MTTTGTLEALFRLPQNWIVIIPSGFVIQDRLVWKKPRSAT